MPLYELNKKWNRLLAEGYVEVAPGVLRKLAKEALLVK